MIIERKSRLNLKAFHNNKTGAIGETKFMIGETFEELPGLFNNFRRYVFNSKELTFSKIFTKLNGNMISGPKTDHRIAFVQDIIGSDKRGTRF